MFSKYLEIAGDFASTIGSGSMQNCMNTYYNCVGLPDGANAIPGGLIKNKYIMCKTGRTIEVKTCPNFNTYDPALKICTQSAEQGNCPCRTVNGICCCFLFACFFCFR